MRWFVVLMLYACSPTVPVDVSPKGSVDVTPQTAERGRDWRRMDLDQLKASMERVSGGIPWSSPNGRDSIDMFDDLASTLGKPDYRESTIEQLDPSLLFQKFLKDAANAVCAEIIAEDGRRKPADRQFVTELDWHATLDTDPDGVRQNLSRLLLRFHGRTVPASAAEIEEWSWLFRSVLTVTEGEPSRAWNAICVALITHPDFYTY